jgi:hypothetical protein
MTGQLDLGLCVINRQCPKKDQSTKLKAIDKPY